jgi:hypothetical protein
MEGDKKPRTEAEKRMNDMRKVAQRNLKVIKSKYTPGVDINEVPVAWTDISKLAGHRRSGNKAAEEEFIRDFEGKAAAAAAEGKPKRKSKKANNVAPSAAAAAAAPAPKPKRKSKKANNSPTNYEKKMAEIKANVRASKFKLNAPKLQALYTARKTRPDLSVANFLKNRNMKNNMNKQYNQVWANMRGMNNYAVEAPKAKFANLLEQVRKNVAESGLKLNVINRVALARARELNPGLSVAEYKMNPAPRKPRAKKNKTEKKNNKPVYKPVNKPIHEMTEANLM